LNITNIEWTDVTWNPVTGCSKVSTGCKNCYAERWAIMQSKRGIKQYKNGFEVTLSPDRLKDPYKWRKAKLVFVNSMSDLFHENIPEEYIQEVFKVMNDLPRHTFQILTKRIERALEFSSVVNWSKNIWLGVSVENNDFTNRIDILKTTSAFRKFISYEPLLEHIGYNNYQNIHWVLVGGESGGKARKIELEWVISIKNICEIQNVPFFFKQWGKRNFNPDQSDPTTDKGHPLYAKGGCMIDKKAFRNYPKL